MKRCSLILVFLPALAARADTVFLKNGEWIDGKVSMKTDTFVELQIGDIGKIDLPLEEIHSIEKNNRIGGRSVNESYVEPKGKTEVVKSQKPEAAKPADKDEKPAEKAEKPKPEGEGKKAGDKDNEKAKAGEGDEAQKDGADEEKDNLPQKPIDPELKKRIEGLVDDLQRQKTRNRVQAERHLEAIGQPTIPFLVPIARSQNELTRIAVMRLFHSFGDQQVIQSAIEGLLDENEYVRDFANKALKRITGEDFGFLASASPRRREVAQKKWADWWQAEKKLLADERKKGSEHH
jgi:hypothetical protein